MAAFKRIQVYFSKDVITKLKKKNNKEKTKKCAKDPLWNMIGFIVA